MAAVADDRHVARHADHHLPVEPHRVVIARAIPGVLDAAIQRDLHGVLRPIALPGRSVKSPCVGLLDLLAVADFLAEQAIFIVDAVAESGHAECRQRVEKAGGEPSKTAVAQRRVDLGLLDLVRVEAELAQHAAAIVQQAKVDEVIDERTANQELERQIVEPFGAGIAIAVFGGEALGDHAVADHQCNGAKRLARRQALDVLAKRVCDVTQKVVPKRRRIGGGAVVECGGHGVPFHPSAHVSTTLPHSPDCIASKPFWNSVYGNRCVMIGPMSRPDWSITVILYHVSYISRP